MLRKNSLKRWNRLTLSDLHRSLHGSLCSDSCGGSSITARTSRNKQTSALQTLLLSALPITSLDDLLKSAHSTSHKVPHGHRPQ